MISLLINIVLPGRHLYVHFSLSQHPALHSSSHFCDFIINPQTGMCSIPEVIVSLCLQKQDGPVSRWVFLVKIMICQLQGMLEIENEMEVFIITSSLYCNIPDYACKSLYKLQAPVRASVVTPVCAPAYILRCPPDQLFEGRCI